MENPKILKVNTARRLIQEVKVPGTLRLLSEGYR